MTVIGGIDVGTTGCKIALYDRDAKLLEIFYTEYESTHENDQHEIDFREIKNSLFSLLKQAAQKYRIAALGVTGFGETFVMLDEHDEILDRSMLYIDPRGAEECQTISDLMGGDRLTRCIGVQVHPMYSIGKILWQKNHNPQRFARCKRILLSEDYIVYTLTGTAQIDYSLAARTAAFDIQNKCWINELFEKIGVDVSLMSTPVAAGSKAGTLLASVKQALGIDYDITVVNGCHDQVAAMIGAGVFSSDCAMDGTGTVECIPVILDQKPDELEIYEKGYSLVPYPFGGYACYALSFAGGATLKWFRDNFVCTQMQASLQPGQNVYAWLDRQVKEEPTGILILPHFSGAATPYMDSASKAAFVGITLGTTKYDIYKALMEGTSYEMQLNFRTLRRFSGDVNEVRATGGGANSDVWLQIKADILNIDIVALNCNEAGSVGTAALAARAEGVIDRVEDFVAKAAPVRKVFSPDHAKVAEYAKYYEKYANLYTAVKGL